jgi:sterol desaturase/sphingolipid hydroxylase (fatty acid hydroxylase superfamily)
MMHHDEISGGTTQGRVASPQARRILWPAMMIGSLLIYGVTTEYVGLGPEMAIQIQFAILFVAILIGERLAPYHTEWNQYDRQSLNDVVYNFLFPAAQFVATSAALGIASWVNADNDAGLFAIFADMPVVVQVLIFALIADLCYYIYHRTFHQFEWLWNFHAVHHSSLQIHILNNARVHPLEVFIAFFPIVAAAYLLQVPPNVLGWFLVLQLTAGLLTHSNIAMTNRWLSWIFNTPELHHWHHSRQIEEQNNNYASTLMIWDQLFGTYHNPVGQRASRHIGTATPVPQGVIGQILFPFQPSAKFGSPTDHQSPKKGETA